MRHPYPLPSCRKVTPTIGIFSWHTVACLIANLSFPYRQHDHEAIMANCKQRIAMLIYLRLSTIFYIHTWSELRWLETGPWPAWPSAFCYQNGRSGPYRIYLWLTPEREEVLFMCTGRRPFGEGQHQHYNMRTIDILRSSSAFQLAILHTFNGTQTPHERAEHVLYSTPW